jgi:very-short-patch-repair endonuclease
MPKPEQKSENQIENTDNSPLEGWQPQADGVDSPNWQSKSLFPFWNLPKNKKLKEKARKLRKTSTLAEVIFWKSFKNKVLLGFDIDRQVIIGNYIVDFFIAELDLVVEIDGLSHETKGEYDQNREKYLLSLGLEVLHYTDINIKKSLDFVSDSFYLAVKKREKYLRLKKEESTPSATLPPLKEGNF